MVQLLLQCHMNNLRLDRVITSLLLLLLPLGDQFKALLTARREHLYTQVHGVRVALTRQGLDREAVNGVVKRLLLVLVHIF